MSAPANPAEPSRYRLRIEAAIESLIALLDEIDGDPDLEDGDEDKAVDDDRCDLADSGDYEPETEGFDPYEPAFVMDQTRAGKAWAS
jgi:hypothetical protein